MARHSLTSAAAWLIASCGSLQAPPSLAQDALDPRLKEVWYDPQAVLTVLVKRGVVTDVVLDADEAITDVATGVGSDCSKSESSWCVAAQPGGRHLFVKPKSTASASNNLAVVTDKRSYAIRFVVLAESDARQPTYRVSVRVAAPSQPPVSSPPSADVGLAMPEAAKPTPTELIRERLTAAPEPTNSNYSMAEGEASEDIVPTLVFDDGRFTYLRFPNNREVPAVFHVLPDGSETLVNVRMEGELLVVDRVSRHLTLRSGKAVVGLWNEAFDLDGRPPTNGTTVSGIERALKRDEASTRPSTGGRP